MPPIRSLEQCLLQFFTAWRPPPRTGCS